MECQATAHRLPGTHASAHLLLQTHVPNLTHTHNVNMTHTWLLPLVVPLCYNVVLVMKMVVLLFTALICVTITEALALRLAD